MRGSLHRSPEFREYASQTVDPRRAIHGYVHREDHGWGRGFWQKDLPIATVMSVFWMPLTLFTQLPVATLLIEFLDAVINGRTSSSAPPVFIPELYAVVSMLVCASMAGLLLILIAFLRCEYTYWIQRGFHATLTLLALLLNLGLLVLAFVFLI